MTTARLWPFPYGAGLQMASDGYWRYADARQQAAAAAAAAGIPTTLPLPIKRPRPEYPDIPGGAELRGYYPRGEDRMGHRTVGDPETMRLSYDRYPHNGISSYGAGEPVRPMTGGMAGRPVDDVRMVGPGAMDGRNIGYGGGRPEAPLPSDASKTLFVEGLPADCSRREVSHIFRPFVGFREVRLVTRESRYPGGDPLILCFVDFDTPSQAAIAYDALQGYKFDEHDRESASLRLQFARFPGPRAAGGPRGRR